jgi:hypothetical protein
VPAGWDRRVLFIANLLSLFYGNEQQTEVLRQTVGAIETYGNRLLPILGLIFHGRPNLLITERLPDPALLRYLSDELGLDVPELEILPHQQYLALSADPRSPPPAFQDTFDRWTRHPADWVDGFVTDHRLEDLASALGKATINTFQASLRGNNKALMHEMLLEHGLPVFDTYMAANAADAKRCLDRLRAQGYSWAAVKSQVGASGIGLVHTPTDRPAELPDYLFQPGACLVQGWLDDRVAGVEPIGSPSVQFFAGDGFLCLFDLTEQILSGDSIHEGNIAPPPWFSRFPDAAAQLLGQAEPVGRWLIEHGYRGTGSVDFLVVRRKGALEIRVCEVNARVTGATYPSILARHFEPGGVWMMRNLRFRQPVAGATLLRRLAAADLLYQPEQESGVLPINFNVDLDGRTEKGQFLFLHRSHPEVAALLHRSADVMRSSWDYDRD